MTEQWNELKETIIELRDNDGTATQQEVCKFLASYMDILEKQMIDPIDRVLEIIAIRKSSVAYDQDKAYKLACDAIEHGVLSLKGDEKQ